MAALYLHSPFCAKVCPYCDFAVLVAPERVRKVWRKSVVVEAQERKSQEPWSGAPFETFYFGGGTPSLLEEGELRELIASLSSEMEIDLHRMREATIEANPESVSEAKIDLWKELGFSRISLGVQSLHDSVLKSIGRNHDRETALRSLSILNKSGVRLSVDLMFALPHQTTSIFLEELREVLDLGLQHISFYGLGIEPQTLFGQKAEKGLLAVDEEIYRESYLRGVELCAEYGLMRYEISNFSVEGEESHHNRVYWERQPYLGLGPGAHSYNGDRLREANPRQFSRWKSSVDSKAREWREVDHLGCRELINEELWLSLRQSKGIALNRLKEMEINHDKLDYWLKRGELQLLDGNIQATEEGWLLIDEICSSLFVELSR